MIMYCCTRVPSQDDADEDAKSQQTADSSVGMQLGEPIFDAEALEAVMFKGKEGVDYKREFAQDFVQLVEELYVSYDKNNHLQTFRAGIWDEQQHNGVKDIRRRVLTTHKEMIQRHVPYLTKYEDDKDTYLKEVVAMLRDLGHSDWAGSINKNVHAGLQRVPSLVPASS